MNRRTKNKLVKKIDWYYKKHNMALGTNKSGMLRDLLGMMYASRKSQKRRLSITDIVNICALGD